MDIYLRKSGATGHITLNRPNQLNSLTYDMIIEIERAIDLWETDKDVCLVIIDSVGEKAFCAGGDIQDLYKNGVKGNFDFGKTFWNDEYRLNAKIKNYSKPFVSFIKGFCMGGGVGISCHGSHRVVGETAKTAMPECGIGLIPDVGGSFILSRSGTGTGIFLGISGERMGPSESIFAGFADYFIPEKSWPNLIQDLKDNADLSIFKAHNIEPQKSKLEKNFNEIQDIFCEISHKNLLNALDKSPRFRYLNDTIVRYSPLSIAAEIRIIQMPEVRENIEKALEIEFRFTSRAMEHGDFIEGVRALVISKDKNPLWRHKSIEKVSDEEVDFILSKI